ncbi:Conserved oligomeric Golgi complex subunit [Coemansia guatemalensis]|uniref:Conserved oligomeric Golgi complex subunit 5 n=1 Tax=Coemansia guatemalensis TaxID=2761395 RepID=A0A9W8HRY9_9FUNG|nr:Conserved oligomeric Golgi complex subunit [Coemansia guatemalensis]
MNGLSPHSSTASGELFTSDSQYRHFEDAFGDFLGPHFEPLQYAQSLASEENGHDASTKADRIVQLMASLSTKAESLDGLMRHTIITSHEDLLRQIVGVKAVDSSLGQIEEQVREIKSYMHGLRTKIRVPYEQVLKYTNQSNNLQLAIAHVRATSRFMQLVQRLRVQIPDSAVVVVVAEPSKATTSTEARPDYALAALTLLDIEKLVSGSDLAGVHVVDRAMEQIVNQRRVQTIAEAESMIDAGMRRQHQSDIASGLQIMFNLGVLPTCVANRVRRHTVEWAEYVSGMLDPKAINAYVREHNDKATAVDGSDMVGIDSVLWKRLEAIVDGLLARGLELRVLERVLARKRDALPRFEVSVGVLDGPRSDNVTNGPGTTFLDLVVGQLGDRVLAFWWGTAVNALAAEVSAACTESSVVKQILTNSYPRLVQLFLPKLEPILAPRFGGVVSIGGASGNSGPLQGANVGLASSPTLVSGSLSQQSSNISYNDPGPHVLWEKLLRRFESEYVAKAELRIEDAVQRCYPPPPPPGLLGAQESWGGRGAPGRAGSPAGERRPDALADMDRMTAANVVPNRKLVAGVVRSISTELEMAKSDARLSGAVAKAALAAVELFISITGSKLSAITVNPSVLDPLAEPVNPLTRSYVGLVNAVESLRLGLGELCEQEYAVVEGPLAWPARRRMSAMTRRTSRQLSAHSSRAGSIAAAAGDSRDASSSPGPIEETSSGSAAVRQMLSRCLYTLSTFVDKQTDALLSTADAAIVDAIKEYVVAVDPNGSVVEHQSDDLVTGWSRIDRAMQWLQTQVLELLETDCQRRLCAMVDRYLFLYFRVVCLAFPLTESTRLRLTGEVTQFEFGCSQLVALASGSARTSKRVALPSLGRSYQVLRLVRPLLFMSAKELARVIASRSSASAAKESGAEWSRVPLLDLVDHTVCRVATDKYASDDVARARRHMPYFLLGCTRRQWIDCVSAACGDQNSAVENVERDICKNPSMQLAWNSGQDVCESCRNVLLESLKRLAENNQSSSDTQELVELIQATIDAVSVSTI